MPPRHPYPYAVLAPVSWAVENSLFDGLVLDPSFVVPPATSRIPLAVVLAAGMQLFLLWVQFLSKIHRNLLFWQSRCCPRIGCSVPL